MNKKYPWVYLVIAVRRILKWAPYHKEVKRRCAVKGKEDLYICEHCEKETPVLQRDHIEPLGPAPKSAVGWDNYLAKAFVDADKIQGLCKPCQVKKTNTERKKRRDNKQK